MDKRISDLNSVTTPQSNDLLAIVNNNETKKITFGNLKENLPGSSTTTTHNSYLVPTTLTVQDGQEVYLTGSIYESTSMIRLDWSGATGTMNLYLPDATTSTNKHRALRLISNNTFSTSTRSELLPLKDSGQTLDGGASSYTINKAYEGIMVWSDGIEWYRVQTKA